MQKQNEIAILLANQKYLYRLFQSIFGQEPTVEQIKALISEHTRKALEIPVIEKNHKIYKLLSILEDLEQQFMADNNKVLEKLKSEYTRLFLGPTKLPAPPWESVYVSNEPLLFQENTLMVRRNYLKYNFVPKNYPHEADDHLALELDFMANLSHIAEEALASLDLSKMKEVIKDQREFLEKHLLNWMPQFAEKLNAVDTYIYGSLASLLLEYLKLDYQVIEEVCLALEM